MPTQYGRPFNGYMGVGIAYPTAKYALLCTEIVTPADSLQAPRCFDKPPAARASSGPTLAAVFSSLGSFLATLARFLGKVTGATAVLRWLSPVRDSVLRTPLPTA